jgi:hypothetical protein
MSPRNADDPASINMTSLLKDVLELLKTEHVS